MSASGGAGVAGARIGAEGKRGVCSIVALAVGRCVAVAGAVGVADGAGGSKAPPARPTATSCGVALGAGAAAAAAAAVEDVGVAAGRGRGVGVVMIGVSGGGPAVAVGAAASSVGRALCGARLTGGCGRQGVGRAVGATGVGVGWLITAWPGGT